MEVDGTHLSCSHHRYMAAGVALVTGPGSTTPAAARVLVVGLGGGGLARFIHDKFPQVR